MGGSGSRSVTDIASESIIKVANSVSTSTGQGGSNTITIKDSNVSKAQITQKIQLTQTNLANLNITNDVLNKITTEMKQQAEASASALTAAISNNESKIQNTFISVLNNDFKMAVSQNVSNELQIYNSTVSDTSISQGAELVQRVITDYLNNNTSWQGVVNDIDQKSETESTLLDFGSGATMIFIVLGILLFGYVMWKIWPTSSTTGGMPVIPLFNEF